MNEINNTIEISGYIASKPSSGTSKVEVPYCFFTVKVYRLDKNKRQTQFADFIPVKLFGEKAEKLIKNNVELGAPVIISGQLRTDEKRQIVYIKNNEGNFTKKEIITKNFFIWNG